MTLFLPRIFFYHTHYTRTHTNIVFVLHVEFLVHPRTHMNTEWMYICTCCIFHINSNYFNKLFLSLIWKNFLIKFECLSRTFYSNKSLYFHTFFLSECIIYDIFLTKIIDFSDIFIGLSNSNQDYS